MKVLSEFRLVCALITPTLHIIILAIHLKIPLDLTLYRSITHRALLIITLQGRLVFQLGITLHKSGTALAYLQEF